MSLKQTAEALGRYVTRSPKAAKPLRASITLTDNCNLRCVGCTVPVRNVDRKGELTTEEMRKLVDDLIDHGVKIFYFFGGEPFLRKDFIDTIQYISDKGLFTETVTNGTIIRNPEYAEKIVKAGLSKIWVSLDGDKEAHDRFRGKVGTYEKAIDGLRFLTQARDKLGSKIMVDMAVTLTKFNYHLLDHFMELGEELDLYEVNVRHAGVFFPEDVLNFNDVIGKKIGKEVDVNDFIFSSGSDILLQKEDMKKLRENIRRIEKEDRKVPIHYEPDIMKIDDWTKGKNIQSCLHIYTQICINSTGGVVPCLWLDQYEMGNIRKQSLDEIWNGENFQHMRKNFKKLHGCSKCCYFYLDLPSNLKRAMKVANFPFKNLLTSKKSASGKDGSNQNELREDLESTLGSNADSRPRSQAPPPSSPEAGL